MPVDVTAPAPAPMAGAREDTCLPRRLPAADRVRAAEVAEIAKVLSDPIRVQIVDLLRAADGDVCQCDLQPHFDVSQPTMSHHLRRLRDAGLIDVERRGKWAHYSLRPAALEALAGWSGASAGTAA